jgi:DNA gyrase subunit B
MYMPTIDDKMLNNKKKTASWLGDLEVRINAERGVSDRYHLKAVEESEEQPAAIEVIRRVHGIDHTGLIPFEFFSGSEYRRLAKMGDELDGLLQEGAYIRRGERSIEVSSFKQALEWLMEEAKRGQNIQRYKGLGEMNPEQLWETTMNPDTRRLLQVTIEDAVGADLIFTTLMGDQVEPRREFIERNAMAVDNLDV